MSDHRKTTAAQREAQKAFKETKPKTALSDHGIAQKAFDENRERLKAERLAREAESSRRNDQGKLVELGLKAGK